jgi:hypothetical protein
MMGTTSWGNKELLIMLLVVLIVIGRRFEMMIRWPPSIASSGERWKDENKGLNRTGIGINRILALYLFICIYNIQLWKNQILGTLH